jgi:hypothetical protein
MNVRLFGLLSGAWLVTTAASLAIPQNFSTGGVFALRAGMRFEEFAAEKETWSSGKLKGDWSGTEDGGEQTLQDEAVVFGLPAQEIKVERSSGRVGRFLVRFRSESGKAAKGRLFDRVAQNVRSFTGDSGKSAGREAQSFRHQSGVLITVRNKSADQVEVEFRPGS